MHPKLANRPYNAVPLAEIAPQFAHFAKSNGGVAPRRRARSLHFLSNRQEETPDVRLSLNRVGVSHVRRIVHLEIDGTPRVFNGEFTMVADLASDKAGVHMSRFSELSRSDARRARRAATGRASKVWSKRSRARSSPRRRRRADVRVRADFGLERWTPVSGKRGEETYTLIGIAHADTRGTRRVVGVEAEGMTACPCAQGMVREHSLHELLEAGFSERTRSARSTRCRSRRTTSAGAARF